MTDTTVTGRADPSAQHRLPYTVEPTRYALRLSPDLESATFAGEVHIEVQVHEAVDEIVLHAAELTVDSARLDPGGGERQPLTVRLDEDAERLVLTPEASLSPGPAVISIEFAGILNDKLHGFYRSAFTDDDGVAHTIATTQFEATDAAPGFSLFRRARPQGGLLGHPRRPRGPGGVLQRPRGRGLTPGPGRPQGPLR